MLHCAFDFDLFLYRHIPADFAILLRHKVARRVDIGKARKSNTCARQPMRPDRTEKGQSDMQEMMQPLIHKAPLQELRVHIGKSGLCIGDQAELFLHDDGQIGVVAILRRNWFGLFTQNKRAKLGTLGPAAVKAIARNLANEGRLRVRIVGLTPEHLTEAGVAEVYVSVWGSPDPKLGVIPASLE